MTETLQESVLNFDRQALHAIKLGLIHPATNQPMEWQIELADDMKGLLEAMRHEDPPTESEEVFEFSEGPYYADDEDFSDEEDWDLMEDEEDVE